MITEDNVSQLGLLIEAGATLEAINGSGIFNTDYLKIDGKLDLQDESQLIQTTLSELAITSAGLLEKDQQGKADLFSYNYWSSPVGVTNTLSNNNAYTISAVLRDGTIASSPSNITYTTDYDGAPTSPITLSNFWMFTYENETDDYSSWHQVFETGILKAGQGYTMKGTGAGSTVNTQNYTFIGKPHNGNISHDIDEKNISLLGNPYPSALDADQFILDNEGTQDGIITGALYFWEHFNTNNSHYLDQYEGGYATYNLAGSTVAIPSSIVSDNGLPTFLPQRYIPVGQGFFVQGKAGGTISFNNAQRKFVKESDLGSIFTFTGIAPTEASSVPVSAPNPEIDRLYFRAKIPEGPERQLLLAVKADKTTGIDYGYDAKMIENNPTDIAWDIEEMPFTIQTVGALTAALELPLMIRSDINGMMTFGIETLQGIPADLPIYFLDKATYSYTDLRSSDASFYIGQEEEYLNRYFIVFEAPLLSVADTIATADALEVYFSNDTLFIQNEVFFDAKNITLYNTLGQVVFQTEKTYDNVLRIALPLQVSRQIYLVCFRYNDRIPIAKKIVID